MSMPAGGERGQEEDPRPRVLCRGPTFRGLESQCGVIIALGRPRPHHADSLPCPVNGTPHLLQLGVGLESSGLPLLPSVIPSLIQFVSKSCPFYPLNGSSPPSSSLHGHHAGLSLTGHGLPGHPLQSIFHGGCRGDLLKHKIEKPSTVTGRAQALGTEG